MLKLALLVLRVLKTIRLDLDLKVCFKRDA